jgi:hypothetical protein
LSEVSPGPAPPASLRRFRPLLTVGVVMVLAIVGMRFADGLLQAQPLAAILLSAVVLDLIVSRLGGELSPETPLAARLKRQLPWLLPGFALVSLVVGVALVGGGGRLDSVHFDPTSLVLGVARSFGLVARRQLPFVLLPLLLLRGPLAGSSRLGYERGLCVFAALLTAELAYLDGDTKLSVLVQGSAALFGAVVLHRGRDLLGSVFAEGAVFFTVGTLFTSLFDVRLGTHSLAPIDRTESPYAVLLAAGLLGLTSLVPRAVRWWGGRGEQAAG